VAAWTDAAELLRFAAANGFLGAALIGLARTTLDVHGPQRAKPRDR